MKKKLMLPIFCFIKEVEYQLLTKYLQQIGYQDVRIFHKHQLFFEKHIQLQAGLFIIDASYNSSLTAIELARKLRLEYRLPLFFIASAENTEFFNWTKIENYDEYLVQPFTAQELKLIIKNCTLKQTLKKEIEKESYAERKFIEQELKKCEERYRLIYDNAYLGLFKVTTDGRYITANNAFLKILGCATIKELTNDLHYSVDDFFYSKNKKTNILSGTLTSQSISKYEVFYRKKDDTIVTLRLFLKPIKDAEGNTIYIEGIAEDITDKNRAKDAIKDSIVQLKESYKIAKIGTFAKNMATGTITVSDNFFEILEITNPKEKEAILSGNYLSIIHPEDRVIDFQIKNSIVDQKLRSFSSLYRIPKPSGKILYINTEVVIMYNEKCEITQINGTIQNVTEQKIVEEQIKASLAEKEILLREIYHRVKNNLQVVTSILNLQTEHITDKKTIEILRECKNRVISMSMVHEKLCQSENLSKINFPEYVRSLISNLNWSYNYLGKKIETELNIEDALIKIDTAIPCGLIINELVSNAFKYAFPQEDEGTITIAFENDGKKNWILRVKDNGIGMDEDIDIDNLPSLGLKLVQSLTDQLGGKFSIKNANGTEFIVTFTE